ncbi:hypothetical protein LZ31DRAFT_338631 [Colletotrichum somersetense]|nr:hypothetical protein LZ31DRAFT_338631 [Colletotrichum somersetense]
MPCGLCLLFCFIPGQQANQEEELLGPLDAELQPLINLFEKGPSSPRRNVTQGRSLLARGGALPQGGNCSVAVRPIFPLCDFPLQSQRRSVPDTHDTDRLPVPFPCDTLAKRSASLACWTFYTVPTHSASLSSLETIWRSAPNCLLAPRSP